MPEPTFPVYLSQTIVRIPGFDNFPNKAYFCPIVLFERMHRMQPFVHRIPSQETFGMIRVQERLQERDRIRKRRELATCWIHGVQEILVLWMLD